MAEFPEKLQKKLQKRIDENALRKLIEERNLIDFSSNDYLGFAQNHSIKEALVALLDKGYSHGATGSRLLSGNHPLNLELEKFISDFHGTETALIFNSGYDANLGFFSSVAQRGDIIFYDELCHASIRDGIRLSQAKSYKFRHNDFDDLKQKVSIVRKRVGQTEPFEAYVATESVFSMDGDSPDIKLLSKICLDEGLNLVVDEAHAVGVFEKGLVNRMGLENEVFARIVTFGKALGSHGAAILGSKQLRTYLINFARSLIYTTALPPHSLAMTLAAYHHLDSVAGKNAIERLIQNIDFFKTQVEKKGLHLHFKDSDSAIQVCELAGNRRTKNGSLFLKEEGFDVLPILAPTVPLGGERLRFCLHAFNTEEEIEKVLFLVKSFISK